jgi:flagella basal body P-ring formation protein FlgA
MRSLSRRSLACLALAATVAPGPAIGATLRPITTLAAPVVLLSDIWDGVGDQGATVLGPGPAPGGRIVVEAAQLAAIARQFGVDWRPVGSERAVLERPGRLLPREDVLSALRGALTGVGAPEDGDLELPAYAAPLVPAEAEVRTEVEAMEFDANTGRFSASVSFSSEGMLTQRQRVAGTLHEMAELPVPVRRIPPGTIFRATDLQVQRVRVAQLRGEVARMPEQVVGMALRRPAMPGQPLVLADLSRPLAVAKGARVTMQLVAGGLALTGHGQALESGAVGDRIQVLNPASRAVLDVEVVGPDRVRIAPGSSPVILSGPQRNQALSQVMFR